MRLTFSAPVELVAKEHLKLAEALHAAGAGDRASLLRLAQLRQRVGDYPNALFALEAAGPQTCEEMISLGELCLEARDPEMSRRAEQVLDRALAVAETPAWRSRAATGLGRALLRRGARSEGCAVLEQALAEDPSSWRAFRRLVDLHVRENAPELGLALANARIAEGNGDAMTRALRAISLAATGAIEEARHEIGLDGALVCELASPPEGWDSLATFNRALVAEMLVHAARQRDRTGKASIDTVRIDEPLLRRSSVMHSLEALLRHEIGAGLDRLRERNAPRNRFDAVVPLEARVRYWGLISDGPGHESLHMHPTGWMSGVYYPEVPQIVMGGDDEAGCLRFALPEQAGDGAAAFDGPLLRPREGLFAMFPSHAYHRTSPYPAGHGRRVCIAFDLEPGPAM